MPRPAPRPIFPASPPRLLLRVAGISAIAAGCVIVEEKSSDGPPMPHGPHVGGDPGHGGGGAPPAGDSAAPEDWDVALTWGEEALTIEVSNAPGGLWLGIVETGGGCATAGGCWDGEDCRDGYTSPAGVQLGPYCHPLDADGRATLEYGGDITALAPGTTAFRSGWAGRATFVLESRAADGGDGTCRAWGDDPSRFLAEGCTLLP